MSIRPTHRRPGVTVIEVMIAVGVIAILMGLLIPALSLGRAAARSAICQGNLHHLGLAYHNRRLSASNAPIVAVDWRDDFAPYVENAGKIYICPEGSEYALAGDPTSSAGTSNPGYVEDQGFPELVAFSVKTNSGLTIPCDPSHARCHMADKDENSYELWFEDWRDLDWDDLRLRFERLEDYSIKITVTLHDSAQVFNLLDGTGAVVEEMDGIGWRRRGGVREEGAYTIVPGNVIQNYGFGFNEQIEYFKMHDGWKIISLDYNKPVIDVVGPDAEDIWAESVAPRHRGYVNVLFANGSVKSMDPDAIDPTVSSLQERYWVPSHTVIMRNP